MPVRRITFKSNGDDISDLVDDLVATFDFTRAGKEQALGKELAHAAAESIRDRCMQGLDPDGNPFKSNEKEYAKYKRRRYDAVQPGILGGQMFSLESTVGQPNISADKVEMVYGTGSLPPANARNGVPLYPSERTATDREKAEYFTASGREFYKLNEDDAEAVMDVAAEAITEYLDEFQKNRGIT
jgi:hypothetical protein